MPFIIVGILGIMVGAALTSFIYQTAHQKYRRELERAEKLLLAAEDDKQLWADHLLDKELGK